MRALSVPSDRQSQGVDVIAPTAGRSACYESFVREQTPRLLQVLSLITRDRELAADAAQDAFLQLYRHWDEMAEMKDPVGWLYKVALNRSRDYRRRLLRSARLFERLVRLDDHEWVAPEVAESPLVAAFSALPRGQRTAATLYYLADFPVAEVARAMAVSEGTVNTHLHRAREALKASLEAD